MGDRAASLGMYDFPWLTAATDAFWQALAHRLAAFGLDRVPRHLDRARPLGAIWRDPDLLLAQTCGYPLVTALGQSVTVVATPAYKAPGCDGPCHRSAVVVPAGSTARTLLDLRGARAAINGPDSNTGMNLLRALIAPLARGGRFFDEVLVTGAHLASLEALRAGRADVAAIDAVTRALVARHRPSLLDGTRVLAATAATPALPLITAAPCPPDELAILRRALDACIADPDLAAVRDALLLETFVVLPENAYAIVAALAGSAEAAGYPVLA